jgi:hypothetical protein
MSLKTTAVNLALARIGVTKTITGLDQPSREAMTAGLVIDHEFRAILRQFPWPFATKYLDLVLEDGTATVPSNADWQYAYTYPTDCVFARRLVDGSRRAFNRNPTPFRVARLGDHLVLYTDDDAPCLEYTAIFDCPEHLGDELFVDAFAWRLAAALGPALSRQADMATRAYQMYLLTLETAAAVGSKEQHQEDPGESEWTEARN